MQIFAIVYYIYKKCCPFLDVIPRVKKAFFKFVKLIPHVRRKIESEMDKISEGFEKDVSDRTKSLKYITTLPKKGLSPSQVLEATNENLGLGMVR